MSGFFAAADRSERIALSGASWVGTPFRKGARLKGAGVDCVNLVVAVYRDAGFEIDPAMPAHYSLDGGRHTRNSIVLDWVLGCSRFVQVGHQAIGDLLCFNTGQAVHHVGLALQHGQFLHALHSHGVIVSNIGDPTYGKRLTHIFRPI